MKIPKSLKSFIKSVLFSGQFLLSGISENKYSKDLFGRCEICGRFTRFYYHKLFDEKNKVVISCKWDSEFTELINIANSMNCGHCFAKYRVRCAALTFMNYFWKDRIKSIKELVNELQKGNMNWKVLETSGTDGVFSDYNYDSAIFKSEFYDDVQRGERINGVYSEDLQNLTFDDNSFDCLIALDVLEHIPDIWKALSEIKRVLKKNGAAIITVPIDKRNNNTQTIAEIINNETIYKKTPSYHSDPLRKEGALVYTEFGTDIIEKMKDTGYDAILNEYSIKKYNAYQFVIIIKK